MRKLILSVIFALFLCVSVYGNSSLPVAAQGAVLMDCKSGRILWEKNSRQPLAMASTTKIMTAIIALENGNLNDTVTVSKLAASAPEVNMNLSAGEQLILEDLLYALMLQSYNDAAVAIAEHISGDVESFCELMTNKAAEVGALDTRFETPNGLDSGDHHSTAYDLALITRYALNNKQFMDIINTPYKTVHSNKSQYDLINKNRLLTEYKGANGVKTGFTGKAGQCFVGAAERDGMQLISVVLASGWGDAGKEQKWVDTKRILDYGFNNYKYVDVINQGEVCATINVARTREPQIDLVFESGVTLPISVNEIGKLKLDYDYPSLVKAPVEKGQVMGSCTVTLGGDNIAVINLLAVSDASRHDLATSFKKVFKEWTELASNDEINIDNFNFIDIFE